MVLVEASAWVLIQPDPLDPDAVCEPAGIQVENTVLELRTNDCGWATFEQPSMADVAEGDTLDLFGWHSALASEEPDAEGVMWLELDGQRIWEVVVPIPAAEEVYIETWASHHSADEGSGVRLHIHNHGGNTWNLASLERSRF